MAITDKEWAERAALALLANMNLTDMMSEINLVKKKKKKKRNKSSPKPKWK